MRTLTRSILAILAVIAVFALSACDTGATSNDPQKKEAQTTQNGYTAQTKTQPALGMDYSPTRDTINGWTKVWSNPGQLAYVYLSNVNGDVTDFYVFKHPPVSMCTALTPTYKLVQVGNGSDPDQTVVVPAPSVDGAYYGGGDCNRYYGFDAVSGAYMEFTVAQGQNEKAFTQPISPQNLQHANAWGKAAQQTLQQ